MHHIQLSVNFFLFLLESLLFFYFDLHFHIIIWILFFFFEFIFSSSTCTNEEVSMSAIKCFNEIVSFLNDYQANNNDAGGDDDYINRLMSLIWKNVWKTWCNIGHHIAANNNVFPSSTTSENSCFDSEQQQQQRLNNNEETTNFLPSQSYLCSFIQSLNIILSKYIHHLTERYVHVAAFFFFDCFNGF